MQPILLAADIGTLIGGIVFLATLVLWVINQIAEGKKQLGKPAGQRPAVPPAPAPRPAAQAGDKPPAASGGLRGEVEDFLRRATQQTAGQGEPANRPAGQRQPPASSERIEVLVDEQGRKIERRRPAEANRPSEPRMSISKPAARSAARASTPVPPRPPSTSPREATPKRESVAEHVRSHIDSGARALSEHSSNLGQRIVHEDEQFDVQLKAKFDHEVGRLASKERVTDTPSSSPSLPAKGDAAPPAAQLAAMLSNPEGVRQAIIVNEILRRPDDRW